MTLRKPKKQKKKKVKSIELSQDQIQGLLERSEKSLDKDDYEIIKVMVETITTLNGAVDQKAANVRKLVRILFGASTETKKNILPNGKNKEDENPGDAESASEAGDSKNEESSASPGDGKKKVKRKGHGRNGADAHTGANHEKIDHPELSSGDKCPKCKEGKLYKQKKYRKELCLVGSAPIQSTVYELENLRCALCGKTFTAPLPEGVCKKKYDTKAISMIALLKYGTGLPSKRLEGLQKNLGMPLAASTQWDLVDENGKAFLPIHMELTRQAAQGDVLHNDDTPAKILESIKQIKEAEKPPDRKGLFTTGIVSLIGEQKIALFFTGHRHAGENINAVLSHREEGAATPIQMCDALNRNVPKDFKTILANCLTHGRRNFVDEIPCFPDECAHVIEILAEVYSYDATTKKEKMSPEQRLLFHQENSGPLMEDLQVWFKAQLDEKKVEPNSGLGKAILYMLNHWTELTVFLQVPGAPLDNNICERALKKAILLRKNSLFFKTAHGAAVGDMFMSIIHTCELSKVNPLDYMMAIIDNATAVEASPEKWLPWNYKNSMAEPSL